MTMSPRKKKGRIRKILVRGTPSGDIVYRYNDIIESAVLTYRRKHGDYANRPCGWTATSIYKNLRRMKLLPEGVAVTTTKPNDIPLERFYWIHNSGDHPYRGGFVRIVSHAIPTPDTIRMLSGLLRSRTTVSVGAGSALWEYLLQLDGCHVIPADVCVNRFTYTTVTQLPSEYDDVFEELIRAGTLQRSDKVDVLFLNWPEPYFDWEGDERVYRYEGYDSDALARFEGDFVVVTSDRGYDQADDPTVGSWSFWRMIEQDFHLHSHMNLPSCSAWDYHPFVKVYRRNRRVNKLMRLILFTVVSVVLYLGVSS